MNVRQPDTAVTLFMQRIDWSHIDTSMFYPFAQSIGDKYDSRLTDR
ncbi:MAG: hypothetical protein OEY89_05225 [Gammaproteobacteria bacterium]|nr:hypothetical protein [Gammaproteobacteria bacterium]